MKQPVRVWLILLCLCGIMFWLKADERSFWGRHGEARRAEVSREMAASGDWLIPHLNGDPFITKPPLYYWSAALMFTLTEEFDEFSARLPSLIAGTFGVLLVALWGSTVFSQQTGMFAGIVLATNFLYCGIARTAGIDMMLTLFTTAALYCFSIGLECRAGKKQQNTFGTRLFLLTAAWIGFGTMTKNPIGLAVPLLAIIGYILLSRDFKLILDTKPWWGLLIFLLITLPWFLLVYLRVPNFFEVLQQETVGRYIDPDGTPHLEPFYYYLPSLGAFAPWVLFVPAAFIAAFSKGFRNLSRSHQFLLIAAVTTFVLFSSVGSKREYYLLPLYPVLALLVSKVWDEYIVMKEQTPLRWTWKSMDIPIIVFAALLGVVGLALPIAAKIYLFQYFWQSIGFGILCVGAGILAGILFVRHRPKAVFGVYTLATIGLYVFALTTVIPEMDRYRSRKEFFQEARGIVREAPLADFHYEGYDVQFYMQRLVEYRFGPEELSAYLGEHRTPFVIMTGKRYDQLQAENPELATRLAVRLDRAWTSAAEPGRQRRLVLLQKEE
jgi:4-amino-4-deoxy-L-arabinose transferase-like glycosyltransferase